MAQYGCSGIFGIEEFVQEEMNRYAKWPQREVSDILGKVECRKGDREGKMGECGLYISFSPRGTDRRLTSIAIPGTNMTTAKAWKNFLLAFTLKVGSLWSAASII